MEGIVDNPIVENTLTNLNNIQHEFKIVFDTIVKSNKYFMDSIYEGICVCLQTHDTFLNHEYNTLTQVLRPITFVLVFFYFQAITIAPFSDIIKHFTPLYYNLNVIWLTSSWFSQKKQMEHLLELISDSIADRVSIALNVPKIFR